jgi:HEAT repeat protein
MNPALTAFQQQQLQQTLLQQQILQQRILQQLLQTKELEREVRELAAGGTPAVKDALKSPRAETRWAAARAVGIQKLPLRNELIDLLTDSNGHVRQAAREGLIQLAAEVTRAKAQGQRAGIKKVDFGPALEANSVAQRTAARKWRAWWERQDADPKEIQKIAAPDVNLLETTKSAAPSTRPASTEVATLLSKELLGASESRQDVLLVQLRDGKGSVYTDTLAAAIPQLTGEARNRARDALVERLTRMKADTLRDKLQDEDSAVRRAAALACAMKEAKAHVPDLIVLLDDPETSVVLAAKAALESLTSQNFGRMTGIARAEQLRVIGDWKNWWDKQSKQ